MRIAILLFDQITVLDAAGPFEVLRSVPGWEVSFVAKRAGEKRDESGSLGLIADHAISDLADPDVVLIPGGKGSGPLLSDDEILGWLRAANETTKWTTSVCTGSLVLGAAGLLQGKSATSHWLYLDALREYGAEPSSERVVFDGKVVTAAGVSSGIDMALRLLEAELGPEAAKAIQLAIEYDPQPPHDAGSPAKAPAEVVAAVEAFAAAEYGLTREAPRGNR